MKTSFANADQDSVPVATDEAVPTTPANTDTSVATQASSAVVPDSYFHNEGVEGDFDKDDVKIPRLAIVQAVGPMSGELGFSPGQIVYNKETVLGSAVLGPVNAQGKPGPQIGTDGVKMTLIRIKKYFLEDLPYSPGGDGPRAAYFKTLDDARKAGFLPIQDKREMGPDHRYVKPVLDADVLIEGTKENLTFPFDYKGTPYAVARWTLQSTAYSRVGKGFFTDSQLALRAGLSTKFYIVSCKREKLGENFVQVPRAVLSGRNDDEFIAWVKSTVL